MSNNNEFFDVNNKKVYDDAYNYLSLLSKYSDFKEKDEFLRELLEDFNEKYMELCKPTSSSISYDEKKNEYNFLSPYSRYIRDNWLVLLLGRFYHMVCRTLRQLNLHLDYKINELYDKSNTKDYEELKNLYKYSILTNFIKDSKKNQLDSKIFSANTAMFLRSNLTDEEFETLIKGHDHKGINSDTPKADIIIKKLAENFGLKGKIYTQSDFDNTQELLKSGNLTLMEWIKVNASIVDILQFIAEFKQDKQIEFSIECKKLLFLREDQIPNKIKKKYDKWLSDCKQNKYSKNKRN